MSRPEITMTIPADSRFVSTVRVAAANLAAELDFSVDEIEEIRMGANELVSTVIEHALELELDTVELRFTVGDGVIEVSGTVAGDAGDRDLQLDFLAEQILGSVVDGYELDSATLRMTKQRTHR